MHLSTRPKLLPPLALLARGPFPGPAAARSLAAAPARHSSNLSTAELRRIVADLIG